MPQDPYEALIPAKAATADPYEALVPKKKPASKPKGKSTLSSVIPGPAGVMADTAIKAAKNVPVGLGAGSSIGSASTPRVKPKTFGVNELFHVLRSESEATAQAEATRKASPNYDPSEDFYTDYGRLPTAEQKASAKAKQARNLKRDPLRQLAAGPAGAISAVVKAPGRAFVGAATGGDPKSRAALTPIADMATYFTPVLGQVAGAVDTPQLATQLLSDPDGAIKTIKKSYSVAFDRKAPMPERLTSAAQWVMTLGAVGHLGIKGKTTWDNQRITKQLVKDGLSPEQALWAVDQGNKMLAAHNAQSGGLVQKITNQIKQSANVGKRLETVRAGVDVARATGGLPKNLRVDPTTGITVSSAPKVDPVPDAPTGAAPVLDRYAGGTRSYDTVAGVRIDPATGINVATAPKPVATPEAGTGAPTAPAAQAAPIVTPDPATGINVAKAAPRSTGDTRIETMPVSAIGVNPRLQYKESEVSDRENNVSGQFKNIDVYDQAKGGVWTVWRDKDGQVYALNSHHRRELANRANRFVDTSIRPGEAIDVPRNVTVRVLDEADGWTVEKARAHGALENIAENKGTGFDAVNVLLDSGFTEGNWRGHFASLGIDVNSRVSRNIEGLINLPPDGLSYVRNGALPEDVVAGIGSVDGLTDAERMTVLDSAYAKAREGKGPETFAKGVEMARLARGKFMRKEVVSNDSGGGLFDDDDAFSMTLANLDIEADIKAGLKRRIERERGDLLRMPAQLLEGESLKIDERNQRAGKLGKSNQQAKDRIDFIFDHDGPLAAMLENAASDVVNGKLTLNEAIDKLYGPTAERAGGDLESYIRAGQSGKPGVSGNKQVDSRFAGVRENRSSYDSDGVTQKEYPRPTKPGTWDYVSKVAGRNGREVSRHTYEVVRHEGSLHAVDPKTGRKTYIQANDMFHWEPTPIDPENFELVAGEKRAEYGSPAAKYLEKHPDVDPDQVTIELNNPERIKLREEIVAKLYDGGSSSKDRIATLVIGGSGSGKSTIGEGRYVSADEAIVVDADFAKRELPEYKKFDEWAAKTHVESNLIADRLLDEFVIPNGDNFVKPMTGSDYDRTLAYIQKLKESGYAVRVVLADLPADEAVRRIKEVRVGQEGGQDVPEEYIRNSNEAAKSTYGRLKAEEAESIDEFVAVDTDVPKGDRPRITERKIGPVRRLVPGSTQARQHLRGRYAGSGVDPKRAETANRGGREGSEADRVLGVQPDQGVSNPERVSDRTFPYETKPNLTQEQAQLSFELLAGLDRTKGSLLAKAIADDVRAEGGSVLLGKRIGSAEDLASLTQVLRDPRWETFRYFWMKGDKVIGHTAISARVPAATMTVPKDPKTGEYVKNATVDYAREQMESHGADGYWILHNHPSGEIRPSDPDLNLSTILANELPGYKGHVVINHRKFAVIDELGYVKGGYLEGWESDDPLTTPAKPHPMLGANLDSSEDLAKAAKSLQMQKDIVMVIGRSAPGFLRAAMELPMDFAKRGSSSGISQLRFMAEMRRFARSTGSADVVLALPVGSREIEPAFRDAIDKAIHEGVLLDVVDAEEKSLFRGSSRNWAGNSLGKSLQSQSRLVANDRLPQYEPVNVNPKGDDLFADVSEDLELSSPEKQASTRPVAKKEDENPVGRQLSFDETGDPKGQFALFERTGRYNAFKLPAETPEIGELVKNRTRIFFWNGKGRQFNDDLEADLFDQLLDASRKESRDLGKRYAAAKGRDEKRRLSKLMGLNIRNRNEDIDAFWEWSDRRAAGELPDQRVADLDAQFARAASRPDVAPTFKANYAKAKAESAARRAKARADSLPVRAEPEELPEIDISGPLKVPDHLGGKPQSDGTKRNPLRWLRSAMFSTDEPAEFATKELGKIKGRNLEGTKLDLRSAFNVQSRLGNKVEDMVLNGIKLDGARVSMGIPELIDGMRADGLDPDLWMAYRQALRENERASWSGISKDRLRQNLEFLDQYNDRVDQDVLGKWDAEWMKLADSHLLLQEEYGLRPKGWAQKIRENSVFYFPMDRVLLPDEATMRKLNPSSTASPAAENVPAVGGSEYVDGFAAMATKIESVIKNGEKNQAIGPFLFEAAKYPEMKGIIEEVRPPKRNPGLADPTNSDYEELEELFDNPAEADPFESIEGPRELVEGADSIVQFWDGGKRRAFKVDPYLWDSMRGMQPKAFNIVQHVLRGFAEVARAGTTKRNPFFVFLFNPMIDMASAVTIHGMNPLRYFQGLSAASIGKKGKLYQEAVENNVFFSGSGHRDLIEFADKYGSMSRAVLDKKTSSLGIRVLKSTGEFYNAASKAIEEATRLGFYAQRKKEYKRKKLGDEDAMRRASQDAADLFNFGESGALAKLLTENGTPYASIVGQSMQSIARGIKRNPIKFIMRGLALLTVPAILERAMYKDDKEYQSFPDYVKYGAMTFRTGAFTGNPSEGDWVSIRIPYELGVWFRGVPMIAMDELDKGGDADVIKAMSEFRSLLEDAYTPAFMPTAAALAFQQVYHGMTGGVIDARFGSQRAYPVTEDSSEMTHEKARYKQLAQQADTMFGSLGRLAVKKTVYELDKDKPEEKRRETRDQSVFQRYKPTPDTKSIAKEAKSRSAESRARRRRKRSKRDSD